MFTKGVENARPRRHAACKFEYRVVTRQKSRLTCLYYFINYGMLNPFRAPEPFPILNPSNFVPKNGFPVVKRLNVPQRNTDIDPPFPPPPKRSVLHPPPAFPEAFCVARTVRCCDAQEKSLWQYSTCLSLF